MSLDLNDLRYFMIVVDSGGFSAAERRVHVTKSKLSRRISLLEERLGVRLLQRNTRRLAPTEAGRLFYDRCVAVVNEAEAAENIVEQLRGEPAGTVRVTCLTSMAHLYVARLVAEFVRRYPHVKVELDATDRYVDFIAERYDVGVGATPEWNQPGLIDRPISTGRFILVAAPTYLADRPPIDRPAQLATLDTVGSLRDGAEQIWTLVNDREEQVRATVRPRMLCSDIVTQLQAVLAGAGVGLLPNRVVERSLDQGLLVHLARGWSAPDLDIRLVYASGRGLLPSVRALIDHLAAGILETGSAG